MWKKSNVFDYLMWRGDLSFQQSEFDDIDALIFSILAYLDFMGAEGDNAISFQKVVSAINNLPDEIKYNGPGLIMHSVVELANKVTESYRYKDLRVYRFADITDEAREIQFAAITFILPDWTAFLAFRGTDNTLIGWKEDLNMCFTNGVPAQIEAAKYAEEIVRILNCPLRLGGHSKGGNLAIWAGTHMPLEYRNRILSIHSNDGPGFSAEFLGSKMYRGIREKIHSFVPESSIVGVLMEHDEYTTICSSNPSLFQHDPFSWSVLSKNFVCDDKRSISGRQFERVINSWLRAMSVEEREELVENVYDIFSSSNAKTLEELDKSKIKSLLSMQKTFREMGVKRQAQLLFSLSKVVFNNDIFTNNNIFNLFLDNENNNYTFEKLDE